MTLEKCIKKFAIWRDQRLLAKTQDICFSAKHVCYHSICRAEYENTAKSTSLAKEDLPTQKEVYRASSEILQSIRLGTLTKKLLLN